MEVHLFDLGSRFRRPSSSRSVIAAVLLRVEKLERLRIFQSRPTAQAVGLLSFWNPPMNLDFLKLDGLIPAIVQDATSAEVLMVAFMNEDAWRMTLETGNATFWSRTRNRLWLKGESSGHRLIVREILTDCDQDAIVLKVDALGPGVCHEGYGSCFFKTHKDGEWIVTAKRAFDPTEVYS
jgi:phosphoribosyl-AMP cyclohydrolase